MKLLARENRNQRGYVLLSVMLLMVLMLLFMTIEAPRVAQQIKRSKEEELIHRGNEYKAAIRKFFRKFGRYPVSIEQLENTNNMRFLRKRYKDPMTGTDEWRLLHVGEVQLTNLPGGVAAPGQQLGQPIAGASNPGQPAGASSPGQPAGGDPNQGSSSGTSQPGSTPTVAPTSGGLSGSTGLSGSSNQFGGGPIIGVASTSKGTSIKELNGKDHYNEWYFVYDPRMEQVPGGTGVPGPNQQINGPGGQSPANPAGGNPPTNPPANPPTTNPK